MPDEDDRYYRRQGFWLRMARERAGKSQSGAAEQIGLKGASKSTISGYERGEPAPQPVLRKLARWYGVPIDMFLHPLPTADEVIDQRLAELGRAAADAEREDWEAEEADQDRAAADAPGDGRRTASA